MPRYQHPISDIPSADEAKRLFDSLQSLEKKAQFSVLWRTGARPTEIINLTRKDVKLAKVCKTVWRKNQVLQKCGVMNPVSLENCMKCGGALGEAQYFIIRLPTLKLGEKEMFKVRHRELRFLRPVGMDLDPYLEMIVRYARSLPTDDTKLFPRPVRNLERWISKKCKEVLGKPLSPYHFRHARFTLEGIRGMGVRELQQFKGAASPQSVLGYLHSKPFDIEISD